MNLLQVIQETPALMGTFIEDVFEAMQNEHVCDDMEQVEPRENVVGQMNNLEKALNFLRNKYSETERRITSRLRGETEPYSPEEKIKLIAELESCRSRFQVANKLMWENIKTRLADQDSELVTGWGIRANHQIVLIVDGKGHNFFEEMLRFALSTRMIND